MQQTAFGGEKHSPHHVSGNTVIFDMRHEPVLRWRRICELQTRPHYKMTARAPDQALRLEERVSALVLAGEEDHVAGLGILPAETLRLAAETC